MKSNAEYKYGRRSTRSLRARVNGARGISHNCPSTSDSPRLWRRRRWREGDDLDMFAEDLEAGAKSEEKNG